MGEPLLNYDEMIKSLYLLNEHKGMNIGQRHITILPQGRSTASANSSGKLQVTLAVSLHAATMN
jgi:23S rRNA (adenine2503-C2)-methyltransferase